jgi:hypothetical protein
MFLAVQNRLPEATSRFWISRALTSLVSVKPEKYSLGLADAVGALADDVAKLRLVIEHGDVGRFYHRITVARHGRDQFYESGRLVRNLGQHLVGGEFLAVLPVVLADAEEFRRIGDRRQEFQPCHRAKQFCALGSVREIFQRRDGLRAAGQRDLDRGRRDRPVQRIRGRHDVDDLIATDDAETRLSRLIGKGCKTHIHFPPGNCTSLSFTSLLHLATSALM